MTESRGGVRVYVPPAKRKQLMEAAAQEEAVDSSQKQRDTWQEERRVVHGTINRLNSSTIKPLIHDLFSKVNLIRLRGVLTKSILQAAVSSPRYSSIYAALVAVINTKLPEVGELVVNRTILAFRKHYRRKEKTSCLATALFMGHLFHQGVVHELLILQVLTLLLDGDPTDDSVEVAVQLMTTVGYALLEVSPAGVRAVLERLRALLHEGSLNKRVEIKMEELLALRKTGFRDHPPIPEELDLVERDDQITFETSLDDEDIDAESHLDVFHFDEKFEEHEHEWSQIRAEILGLADDDGESETDDDDSGSDNDEESDEEEVATNANPDQEQALVKAPSQTVTIQDMSESDLIHLRRTIYLTIMSSATFEECTHKLAKIDIPKGREEELINMIIECCSQERTFLRYYGLIAARFCLLDDRWRDAFLDAFVAQYTTIHRLETNKLRNVAKLFAHLLHTDSIPWSCLGIIHLNEDETTSSSRIFVKILVQEMAEAIGIAKLKKRFETDDPIQKEWFKEMFPQDNVRNTRYAINFFTSIGLGPLTDGLREFLKNAPKMILAQAAAKKDNDDSSVSSSSSSSSSSGSSTSSSSLSSSSYSSSSSSSSDSRGRRRSRKYRRSRRRSRSSSSDGSSSYSSSSRSRARRRSVSRTPSTDGRREPSREARRRVSHSSSPTLERAADKAQDSLAVGEDTRDKSSEGEKGIRQRKRSRSVSSRSSSSASSRDDRRKRSKRRRSQSSSRSR
jgi:pre-mRNA-splicing factor CWC22